MEFSQVHYFLALYREKNFTRAAKSCGVAQPSLSNSIKCLEAELGEPLFVRRHTGVEPTELSRDIEPYFAAIERCIEIVYKIPQHVNVVDREIANDIARRLKLPQSQNPQTKKK